MIWLSKIDTRGRSRAAASSKMECFVIIVNGFQPVTIITKHSILDVAAVLDLPLNTITKSLIFTLYGGDSKGFIMGFMALINRVEIQKQSFNRKKFIRTLRLKLSFFSINLQKTPAECEEKIMQ